MPSNTSATRMGQPALIALDEYPDILPTDPNSFNGGLHLQNLNRRYNSQ